MLFLLTGDVQTGKSRWLESLAGQLSCSGVSVAGVLAPGQWVASVGEHADENGFEKRGIDNVLLPQHERMTFARRQDLALSEGAFEEESQAAQAQLKWHIFEDALTRVNVHFEDLHLQATGPAGSAGSASGRASDAEDAMGSVDGGASSDADQAPALLIVDELGRLELLRGGGLTEAVSLLREGPTRAFPNALVVVREALLADAEALLGTAWPQIMRIGPDDAGRRAVLAACVGA